MNQSRAMAPIEGEGEKPLSLHQMAVLGYRAGNPECSQREAAAAVGVSQPAIAVWLKRHPSFRKLWDAPLDAERVVIGRLRQHATRRSLEKLIAKLDANSERDQIQAAGLLLNDARNAHAEERADAEFQLHLSRWFEQARDVSHDGTNTTNDEQ